MAQDAPKFLLTGSTGRLGTELKNLLTEFTLLCPSRHDLDLNNAASVLAYFTKNKSDLIVHTAAYTNVSGAENERKKCWQTNVEGTRLLVEAARNLNIKFVHISTDYVFYGDTGMYKEEDTPGPVRNYYALTKLVAEESVKTLKDYLIIRTSFRPKEWPYESAFTDVFTSQDYVDIIAPEIALALQNHDKLGTKILHIATERKSVYELAKRRKTDVLMGSKKDAKVALPDDVSLDVSRWQTIKKGLKTGKEE